MKLYRIRGWGEQFENNRSRTVKDLAWVAIPNRHDGENYTAIITSKDGAEIFSAWVLMVQVASRCQPRGTLLRGNGTPHDSASLAIKTRAPKTWFDKALKFLSENTDWLEIEDVAGGCQEAVSQPSGGRQSGDEEQKGTEQKGIEGKEKPRNPEHQAFVQGWTENFKAHFGSDYVFQGGRDGRAVKELLGAGVQRIDLLEEAKRAWRRAAELPVAFHCKQAATISGFHSSINHIRQELKTSSEPLRFAPKPPPEQNQLQEQIKIPTL